MHIKLLVLSPFDLPFSPKKGKYTVGDSIYFNLKSPDEKSVLVKLLSDIRYKNIVQPISQLPEEITKELQVTNSLLTEGKVSKYETVKVEEREQHKLNQILKPAAPISEEPKVVVEKLEQEVKSKEIQEETNSEVEVEKSTFDSEREESKAKLEKMHWASLRKLAEETYGLTYVDFDKHLVIEDILKIQFG